MGEPEVSRLAPGDGELQKKKKKDKTSVFLSLIVDECDSAIYIKRIVGRKKSHCKTPYVLSSDRIRSLNGDI